MSNEDALIIKTTLHPGSKQVDFKDGTKVFFHFQTRQCDKNETLLDDSRTMGKGEPLHIVFGKKFKLEVWEAILKKMALNEVAKFKVDKSLIMQYPFVSKTLRDIHTPKERRSHCCAMTLQNEGVGYDDLNDFLKCPTDLEFTMEIVDIQQPDDYEKETWQMDDTERTNLIPKLKNDGNNEYRNKNYKKAAELYAKAIGILEQFMIKEKPNDTEWNELNQQKMPILLNYAQCKLQEGDYYSTIEHCNEVIKFEKENVKAYYRRGKAHAAVWNIKEAKEDFNKAMELDSSLTKLVKKELFQLDELVRQQDKLDKLKLQNMFT